MMEPRCFLKQTDRIEPGLPPFRHPAKGPESLVRGVRPGSAGEDPPREERISDIPTAPAPSHHPEESQRVARRRLGAERAAGMDEQGHPVAGEGLGKA